MNGPIPLWVALAGGAGAIARFVADGAIRSRVGHHVPYGTLVINVSGSLLLGVFTGIVLYAEGPALWTAVAGTGFCGGFTTFSTASFETARLLQERRFRAAWSNALLTLVLALAAAALGLALTRL